MISTIPIYGDIQVVRWHNLLFLNIYLNWNECLHGKMKRSNVYYSLNIKLR
jgi:hypothetical protein